MITVTLGTIPYPFDRAIRWLSLLLEQKSISEPVFLQHGVTNVKVVHKHHLVTAAAYLSSGELTEKICSSRLVISHAGQGSTRKLANQAKSFIILPRCVQYGEHVDDHQLQFAEGVGQLGVTVCNTLEDLRMAIRQPPEPLQRDLFSGPKLGDYLAEKYSRPTLSCSP